MSPERSESQEEERPTHRSEEREARESEGHAPDATRDRGESVGDPDVLLDVPVLNVEELELEVEELRARVSYGAELADMVKINVGIDAEVGRAKIGLRGVEVQAQLKARLDNVRAIFSEVLTALQRDPDLAQNMLRAGSAQDAVRGAGVSGTGGGTGSPGGSGPGSETEKEAEPPTDGAGGGSESGSLENQRIEEEYIDEQGRLVRQARDESGRIVEEAMMDENGNTLGSDAPTETGEDEGPDGAEATHAARRKAHELGLDLSGVSGTGSGGRILLKDVEDAGRSGG